MAWHYRKGGKINIDAEGLVVMALYQGLIKEKIPCPTSHLCQEVCINPKIVWRWIKLYRQDLTDSNKLDNYMKHDMTSLHDMKEYFLQPLQLNYQEMTSIEQILKK